MLRVDAPTRVRLTETNLDLVKAHLSYIDKTVDYNLRRLKKARWFDPEAHQEQIEELQKERRKCLLQQDEEGYYTLSGLAKEIQLITHEPIENTLVYPDSKIIPWANTPPELRPYQQDSVELLLQAKHGAVELATGLGKSFILMHIAKQLGLKTVVMAPTTSIADQLYDDFTHYLGKSRVGRYYGGKKDSKRLVTVAIHASLARIEPSSEDWERLASSRVFIADESHLTPAETLKSVCLGLLDKSEFRFFLSGTQMRGDGADVLLRGITGPVLKRMTVTDGVNEGWLAAPRFRVIQTLSQDTYDSADALKMSQRHLLYNPQVIEKAAAIANAAVTKLNHQVLILIDEVKQFRYLLPHLRAEVKFAHGPLTKANEGDVAKEYRSKDNTQLVKDYNARKFPILIGTSAVGMGTDIKSVQTLIYLMGGKSEVQVRQAVGRGTRKVPGKEDCTVIDFDVTNIDMMHRHAVERQSIYRSIYDDLVLL